jgi:PAS domain S-box-containing protein
MERTPSGVCLLLNMPSPTELDLSEALERDEISPYFQPVVELTTGKLTGFEVLARWKHPVRGMVPPDVFISLAEKAGLIGRLMEQILCKAFAAASVLPDSLSLSANISAIQFRNIDLPLQIEHAVTQGGFAFHRLILEVTESALADNLQQAREISMRLKELGIRLALDDFGTGYSSLRHLQALPFDELKVDASFVRSMDHTRESRKIAAAIVGLGHSLGLITVAEGIETQVQAEMLLWLGCDCGQGWLYGRAVPAEELPGILAQESLSPHAGVLSGSPSAPAAARLEALPALRLAQLQAIYDGAPVGLCFLDTSMRYISINKRLAEMNGAPVADHIGRRVKDLYPEMFKIVEPFIRTALQGKSLSGIEATYAKAGPEGRPRTLLLSYQPARDEANEVIGVSVAVVDISSRKLAEEALKESEDHYRHAVELNPQIPWTASPDFVEIDVSPSWQKLTGMSAEEIHNHGWLNAVHPDDMEPARNAVGGSIETGAPIDLELRVRRADGAWIWIRSRGSPRRDAEGKIVRWYGSMEDIDDRKKMAQALIESEALLKAVFDAVPVGIVITEASTGRVVISNPQAEKVFRRPVIMADNIDSYRNAGALHPDGSPMMPSEYPLARAIVTGNPVGPEEFLYRGLDGSDGWVSATAAPVRGRDGQILGGVVALLDIDDLKRERQTLLDQIAELERQVRELRSLPITE